MLLDATADLVLTRLPSDGPLWRARLLVRPDGPVAALALAAHHVVADGMGGLAVLGALADGGREPGIRARRRRAPETLPPWPQLAREAWAAAGGAAALGHGRRSPHRGPRRARAASSSTRAAVQPAGRHRRRRHLELAAADLEAVRARAHASGATVNDVVVTAVTGALVELLARRGERVAELVVSVPVSRRLQGSADTLGNATGVVPVRVPAVPDAAVRLAALVAQRTRFRAPGRGGSAAVLTPAFRALAAVGAFQGFVDHQRLVHTFVTNVRGPAHHLRLAGAEVTSVVPVAVNPGNVAVSFDVLSYAGTLLVTLVCDPGLVPESAWLAARVTAGLTASGSTRRTHPVWRSEVDREEPQARRSTTCSTQPISALTSSGSTAGNMPRAAGCGRACGRARRRRRRWRAASLRRRAASTASSKSMVADDLRTRAGSADERGRVVAVPRPSRRAGREESVVRSVAQSRPPLAVEPLDLVAQQHSVAMAGVL